MDDASSYEQQRERNMRENAAMLQSLGIETRRATANAGVARGTRSKRPPPVPRVDEEPRRRSARLVGASQPNYRDDPDWSRPPPSAHRRPQGANDTQTDEDSGVTMSTPPPPPPPPSEPAAAAGASTSSSKFLEAALSIVEPSFLGKQIPPVGGQIKRSVMNLVSPGRPPTFNRYSGIQEWLNAVFLFVNVGGADYANVFSGGGCAMTWFAQPTQHADTPVIRKLLRAPRVSSRPTGVVDNSDRSTALRSDSQVSRSIDPSDALPNTVGTKPGAALPSTSEANAENNDGNGEPTAVLLFCRPLEQPYVYCGRLALVECNLDARPMRFKWRLLSAEQLQRDSELFRNLVANG